MTLVTALIGGVAVLWLATPYVGATGTDDSVWLNQSLHIEVARSLTANTDIPYRINGNRDCYKRPVTIIPFKILTVWPYVQQEVRRPDSCVVDTLFGSVATGAGLQGKGVDVYGEVAADKKSGHLITPVAVPNSSTYLYFDGQSAYGNYMRYIVNATPFIKTETDIFGRVFNSIDTTTSKQLTDKSGQRVDIRYDSISFSRNGKWMIADSPLFGIVRVNLHTLEVLPFSVSFNYKSGVGPSAQTAITEDGRYAAVGSAAYARFNLYDLDTCPEPPNKLTGPVTCQAITDLYARMQTHTPGFKGFGNLKFYGDQSLYVYGSYIPPGTTSAKFAQFVLYTSDSPSSSGMQYLALGDSFASGEGAYNYKSITDTPDNRCHLSLDSYPYLVASALGLASSESIACSGARIPHITQDNVQHLSKNKDDPKFSKEIYSGFLPGYRAQLNFLEFNKPGITTISIGGNDIGFANIILRCISPGTCYEYYEDRFMLLRLVNSQFYKLVSTYRQLIELAPSGSKIYVIGYPKVVAENGNCALNVNLNNQEIVFANQLTDYLNDMIRRAADNAGVYYVDISNSLNGYRLCETESNHVAVNGLTAGNDNLSFLGGPFANESYHPNAKGQQLMATAVLSGTHNFTLAMPPPNPNIEPQEIVASLPILNHAPTNPKTATLYKQVVLDPEMAIKVLPRDIYEEVVIDSSQALMNQNVDVWLYSTPIHLGSGTADANGYITTGFTIPRYTPPGVHTLHIYGKNVIGESVDVRATVYVAATMDDYDGDGQTNTTDPCPTSEQSGVDVDQDGVDDACDGFIGEPLITEEKPDSDPEPAINSLGDSTLDTASGAPEEKTSTQVLPTITEEVVTRHTQAATLPTSSQQQSSVSEPTAVTSASQGNSLSYTPDAEVLGTATELAQPSFRWWKLLIGLCAFGLFAIGSVILGRNRPIKHME